MAANLSATYRSLISAGCVFKALSSIPRRDHLDMEELKWPSVVLGLEVRAGWMIMRKVVQPKSRREELVNDQICEHPKDLAKSWDQIKSSINATSSGGSSCTSTKQRPKEQHVNGVMEWPTCPADPNLQRNLCTELKLLIVEQQWRIERASVKIQNPKPGDQLAETCDRCAATTVSLTLIVGHTLLLGMKTGSS